MKENVKILIINSQSIYKDNATGITLRSIVKNLPQDSVLEVYRNKPNKKVVEEFEFTSIQIPAKSMPINYLLRKFFGKNSDCDADEKTIIKSGNNVAVKQNFKRRLIEAIKAIAENSIIIAPKSFVKKIDEFQPDYIYTMGASFYVIKWTMYFQKRYKCPIVMHYMDNWRETIYTHDKAFMWINKLMQKKLCQLESRMKVGLTISEIMAEAYEATYGHKYLPLMNVVNDLSVRKEKHDTINFVYAGGLHLDRDKQLLEVEKAIKKINILQDCARLYVFTSKANIEMYSVQFDPSITTFEEAVPHDKVFEVYQMADILIHVESFDKQTIEYTKYSMSTKIPEYMKSGKAILCFAPENIASYQYIKQHKAGVCISSYSELCDAVELLLSEKNRLEFSQNGILVADKNHSPERLKAILGTVFS